MDFPGIHERGSVGDSQYYFEVLYISICFGLNFGRGGKNENWGMIKKKATFFS